MVKPDRSILIVEALIIAGLLALIVTLAIVHRQHYTPTGAAHGPGVLSEIFRNTPPPSIAK